jgi:hypothetical protein
MIQRKADELDARLASLARDVEPARDLWPAIAAAIAAPAKTYPGETHVAGSGEVSSRFPVQRTWAIAASLLLMTVSSGLTYAVMQRSMRAEALRVQQATVQQMQQMQQMQPVLAGMPASFGGQQQLGVEYSRARAGLDAQFALALQALAPTERARLERSLADLRRAANELSVLLAEHPSDPLLQELLLSTYQNELGLLARVNDLQSATSLGADS